MAALGRLRGSPHLASADHSPDLPLHLLVLQTPCGRRGDSIHQLGVILAPPYLPPQPDLREILQFPAAPPLPPPPSGHDQPSPRVLTHFHPLPPSSPLHTGQTTSGANGAPARCTPSLPENISPKPL